MSGVLTKKFGRYQSDQLTTSRMNSTSSAFVFFQVKYV